MCVDCYATADKIFTCAKNLVKIPCHNKPMKLFLSTSALEFVAIDIHGELVEYSRKHKYLMVISDRSSKPVCIAQVKAATAENVAKAFVTHLDNGF